MKFDELFDNRYIVGCQLKNYIRDKGYTKVSFASKANISRPTLDKLLNGDIDNKTTFDKHFQKILKILNISINDLLLYQRNNVLSVDAVYSKNMPIGYEMEEKAKKEYDLLLDMIELCEIYY